MTLTTPDLCDRYPDVNIAEPLFRHFGGRTAFSGPMATVRCFEDNSRVRELAATPCDGRVLVVDGQGSLKHALLGDQVAAQAVANGWAGVLIHGCVRDVEILATLPLGVLARARRCGGAGEFCRRRVRAGPLAVCRCQRRAGGTAAAVAGQRRRIDLSENLKMEQ